MSTDPVKLFYDKFMNGLLPADGARIDKDDLVLTGKDGTSIIILKNSNTVYKELPIKVFEAMPNNTGLFKFVFPIDTTVSGDGTTYTTPSNSVYTFSSAAESHNESGRWTKFVSGGTIQIRPPDEYKAVEEVQVISNATTNAASLSDSSFMDDMKDNPFCNMLKIVYSVFRDMIIVVIFWILFISISCWVMVPSDYLYPTDTSTYPFVYYKSVGKYYDYLNPDEEDICKTKIDLDTNLSRKKQKELFDEFEKFKQDDRNKDKTEILKAIYPQLFDTQESSVNFFSRYLIQTCAKPELDATDHIRYVILILLFQNFVYCNRITSMIHSLFSTLSTDILGRLDTRILVVLFAFLLYGFFSSSGAVKNLVIELFKIKFKEETDIGSFISNQIVTILVYILAACMCIFIPLSSILAIVCLMVTTYTLAKNVLAPFNTTIWVFSLVTILFSIGSYLSISLMLGGVMNPKELVSFNNASTLSLFIFIFSLVGVGLPLLFAIGYSGRLSLKLFVSFFSFTKIDVVVQRMIKSIPSLVMIALLLLFLHVNKILGKTYSVITFTIIFLIGAYVWLTKSKK